ncbi:MAG: hypothetical protein JW720_00070 [Sedimentisphaerales bacterium]|nr:hypothetical protein [Sedimentisphaerales bacterium]
MKIPGFIDIQVNGYKGVDFSSGELKPEDFVDACRGMLQTGTAAFLPTMVTSPEHIYRRNLGIIAEAMELPEFRGRLLGIHLEGPFISSAEGTRGAHNADWIRPCDIGFLEELLIWAEGNIRLLTIAAEGDGAEELTRYATGKGIAVALGHHEAQEGDLRRLVRAGAAALTHLGNGIPAMLDRHNNPLWAGLAEDDLAATIITDGNHLPPSILKTIIRTKGPERCIVISDATSLAGYEPGVYETLGHKVVFEESGRLYDPETGYMCGSSATMLKCMNHLASLDIVGADELVAMGLANPLKLIGLTEDDVTASGSVSFDAEHRVFRVNRRR